MEEEMKTEIFDSPPVLSRKNSHLDLSPAKEAGVSPPVKALLHDAARALQLVRSNAGEWNLDRERIPGGCPLARKELV
jgi:hypothetical protein